MEVLIDKKAVSVFILIILMLGSMILGAFISYLLVMTNYYNMPENTTLLVVTDAIFPVNNATYFNVTVLNPSNSVSDVNITAIRLSVEGKNESYDISSTEPGPLPLQIEKGAMQTFKCKRNWSNFAGETVRIEPISANASTKSFSYFLPKVKLNLTPTFDESKGVENFTLFVENSADSVINLTISEIIVNDELINENVTPSIVFPPILAPGKNETFLCNWSWDWRKMGSRNVTITVNTAEGYSSIYTSETRGVYLSVEEVQFDYTDPTYFNLTIRNSEESLVTPIVSGINLTLQNRAPFAINETRTRVKFKMLLPTFRYVPRNGSRTFDCYWNWSQYRDENFTVSIYTEQGFSVSANPMKVPSSIVWNATDIKFDFSDLQHFTVNVTNTLCSLSKINVTRIQVNGTNVKTMTPQFLVLKNGEQGAINCAFDWNTFRGSDANVTIHAAGGLKITRIMIIPRVELKLLGGDVFPFGELSDLYEMAFNITIPINATIPSPPYINVTISNSVNSLQNVTLNKITIEAGKEIYEIINTLTYPKLAPNGYVLEIGKNITIICISDWTEYLTAPSIKVTVYTAEGFYISRIWKR